MNGFKVVDINIASDQSTSSVYKSFPELENAKELYFVTSISEQTIVSHLVIISGHNRFCIGVYRPWFQNDLYAVKYDIMFDLDTGTVRLYPVLIGSGVIGDSRIIKIEKAYYR